MWVVCKCGQETNRFFVYTIIINKINGMMYRKWVIWKNEQKTNHSFTYIAITKNFIEIKDINKPFALLYIFVMKLSNGNWNLQLGNIHIFFYYYTFHNISPGLWSCRRQQFHVNPFLLLLVNIHICTHEGNIMCLGHQNLFKQFKIYYYSLITAYIYIFSGNWVTGFLNFRYLFQNEVRLIRKN